MISRILYLFLLAIGLTLPLFAQNPAHFEVGEDELANINIYDITQDPQLNYWLATNKGIIKYDGYTFSSINNIAMLSTSVFGWKFDGNHALYCYNLSGQIFRMEGDHCSLYFQIPDSLMSNEIYFDFDEDNNLVVATNSIFIVKSGNIQILFKAHGAISRFSTLFKKRDGSLLSNTSIQRSLIIIRKGDLQEEKLTYKQDHNYNLQFMYLGDSLYYYDKNTARIVDRTKNSYSLQPPFITNKKEGLYRFYTDNVHLFVALPSGGILLFDSQFNPVSGGRLLFKNEIISSFYKDREGNLIFGTFKGGLIIIPNIHLLDIVDASSSARFTKITGARNSIYVGTQDGKVYRIVEDDQLFEFRARQVKSIEGIGYVHPTNELLVDENFPQLISLKNGDERSLPIGAVKDIESVSDKWYLIATNRGVHVYNPLNLPLAGAHNDPTKEINGIASVPGFEGRINCVNYDLQNASFYAGTPQGLKLGNVEGIYQYKLNNETIIALDIQYDAGRIYVGTQNQGLLIFENGRMIDQWTIDHGLFANTVNQVKIHQERIYLATSNGFQVLNFNGELLHSLKQAEGLHNLSIIDFELNSNTLWLVQQKGIQKIALDKLPAIQAKPAIKLEYIVQGTDTLDTGQGKSFKYNQSRFEFVVSAVTLRYQSELQYLYQLSGIDKEWQSSTYEHNKITYVSLPPGNYSFNVKAQYRNQQSETVSYSFAILPPFWTTWWFYSLMVTGVLFMSSAVFLTLYVRQRKKIEMQNELNNSKLSAIQSQMNPHFIFNALNSIQDFIVHNNKKMASRYLGKFADLMRIYLNHSQIKTISLQEEIEALSIYLELEKLRFETLESNIEVDERLQQGHVLIPTLLIQPYVENALKHGLLHNREANQLYIAFRYIQEHDLIECEIRDNGIGRLASAEVNKLRNPNHKSFATKATKNRLELLNFGQKRSICEQINDLYDSQGKAAGTQVILRIPVLY